jgi:putative RNA 2'-phosphotransferase
MIDQKEFTRISKFLSHVLRHKPQTVNLSLDENGWADTTELIEKMVNNGMQVNMPLLEQVVATNSKKRFSFNDDKTKIRANQGHSVTVDLQLIPVSPPPVLYHGTSEKSLAAILEAGLQKRNRHHVHLSADASTAVKVGSRHGKPVVLVVDAEKMHNAGFEFFLSDNNVWLTDNVPPVFLSSY